MKESEKDLKRALEELNYEYIMLEESKEYTTGKKVINILKNIKKFNIRAIIKVFSKKRKNKIEDRKLKVYRDWSNTEYDETPLMDKKIVVYSCITGDYDDILEPLYIPDNIKYVLYTNLKEITSKNWEVRPIPEDIEKIGNNILVNRYIKMHPHELFKNEFDYSIYIDGNIKTISDLSPFVRKINNTTGLAIHRHYARDDIYMEVETCILYKKGNKEKLMSQAQNYKNEGMPTHFGLLECNVLVSDLKNETAKKIFDNWWEEFIKSESLRDQISLPYIVWKMGYKVDDIGCLGYNVYKNPKLRRVSHK